MMMWVKYGPLRQLTDQWAAMRPTQRLTLFFGYENLTQLIGYFDVAANTPEAGEIPCTLEKAFSVGETDLSEMATSVVVKDIASVLEDLEPERGGYVKLEFGKEDFLPGAQFKNPVDSLTVGYTKIRRYEPDYEYPFEYTHGNARLRVNEEKGLLMIRKGDFGLHVKPSKWGDDVEYRALGKLLNKSFDPELNYTEEELPPMTEMRRRRNPLASEQTEKPEPAPVEEPQGVIDDEPEGPLAGLDADDMVVEIDPSSMVVEDDEYEEPPAEEGAEGTVAGYSIEDDPDVDAALSGSIHVPDDEEEEQEEEEEEEEPAIQTPPNVQSVPKDVPTTPVEPGGMVMTDTSDGPSVAMTAPAVELDFDIFKAIEDAETAAVNPPSKWRGKKDTRERAIDDLTEHGWLVLDPEQVQVLKAALVLGTAVSEEVTAMATATGDPEETGYSDGVAKLRIQMLKCLDDLDKVEMQVKEALESVKVEEPVDPIEAAIEALKGLRAKEA